MYPQVIVYVPWPRPKDALDLPHLTDPLPFVPPLHQNRPLNLHQQSRLPTSAATSPHGDGGGDQQHQHHQAVLSTSPMVWNDEVDARLWAYVSVYPHNNVKWDVVASKLNTSAEQCMIRFLHLYQQQLHQQLRQRSFSQPQAPLSTSPGAPATGGGGIGTGTGIGMGFGTGFGTGGASAASPQPSTSPFDRALMSPTASLTAPLKATTPFAPFTSAGHHGHMSAGIGATLSSGGAPLSVTPTGSGSLTPTQRTRPGPYLGLPTKEQFLECVERHKFEWLTIGRELNHNPLDCRSLYLSLVADESPSPSPSPSALSPAREPAANFTSSPGSVSPAASFLTTSQFDLKFSPTSSDSPSPTTTTTSSTSLSTSGSSSSLSGLTNPFDRSAIGAIGGQSVPRSKSARPSDQGLLAQLQLQQQRPTRAHSGSSVGDPKVARDRIGESGAGGRGEGPIAGGGAAGAASDLRKSKTLDNRDKPRANANADEFEFGDDFELAEVGAMPLEEDLFPSIDQSTLASAFMSTFLRGSPEDRIELASDSDSDEEDGKK